MTTVPIYQMPLKLQLKPSLFGPGATNTYSGITVTCTSSIQNHSWVLPSFNAAGMLNNDGTGRLRWINPQQTTIGIQNITVTTSNQNGVISMDQLGTGACSIRYSVPGIDYNMGIDQNDSNIFKLSRATTLGNFDVIKFSTGELIVPANMTMPDTMTSGSQGIFRMGTCNYYALNADGNLFIGNNTGNLTYTTPQATQNTGIGRNVFSQLTTGYANSGFGDQTLPALTTGYENTAFGHETMLSATTAFQMTAYGAHALSSAIASDNCAAFGCNSLIFATGNRNSAFGARAGYGLTTGEDNTFFGYNTNVSSPGFSNSTIIGSGATAGAANRVQLGNASVTSLGVGSTVLTTNQIKQLVNLPNNPAVLLQASAWINLAGLNQALSTTSSPTFANMSITGTFSAASFAQTTIVSAIQTITTNTVLNSTYSVIRVDCTSGPITLTLPPASAKPSQEIKIVKVDSSANECTIVCQPLNTISYTYTQFVLYNRGESLYLISMGSPDNTWNIF